MVSSAGGNGSDGHRTSPDRGAVTGPDSSYGTSQIGVHDLVPELGYREYWYPVIEVNKLGKRAFGPFGRKKPVHRKVCGIDLVLFQGKDGKVGALWDRCPHRGSYLSRGRCEFDGTVSCPYHGATYNEKGECVAALTEGPTSGLVGKMRAKSFPTEVLRGVVFVWMGQTEPVPIEEDMPEELYAKDFVIIPYSKVWPMNWTLAVENSGDNHFSYIHRFRVRRMLNLTAFHKLPAYWPGVKIVDVTENQLFFRPAGAVPMQMYYPGLGKKWPQHVWYRFMPYRKPADGQIYNKPYTHEYRLPSIARVFADGPGRIHMRWGTPIDENSNLQWTFGMARVRNRFERIYWQLHLKYWYKYHLIKGTNELEDVPVQRFDRMDTKAPQKLGANDAPIIIWRRKLPMTSRDNQRMWKKGIKDDVRIVQVDDRDVVEEVEVGEGAPQEELIPTSDD